MRGLSLKTCQRLFGVIFILGFIPPVVAQNASRLMFDSTKNILLNTSHNENWIRFAIRVKTNKVAHKENITIVHIGDSHIQGGYFTNRFRELLFQEYRVKERGFVFPYTLIKANGPEDVRFYSIDKWEGQKYNRVVTKEKVGISGYHFLMTDTAARLAILLKQGSEKMFPFLELSVFHNNPCMKIAVYEAIGSSLDTLGQNLYITKVKFKHPKDSALIQFSGGKAGNQLYGFALNNNKPGISYHSVGVNGASFETFVRTINYMAIMKALQPDCVIISLGTNDCYVGQLDTALLNRNIHSMVESIRQSFPKACILLTTPNDYLIHKKYLNSNLILASSIIKRVSDELGCVCWDFYEVMGRMGASKRWAKNGLMYKDILHLSKEGYKLQGELFFNAFSKAIENGSSQ